MKESIRRGHLGIGIALLLAGVVFIAPVAVSMLSSLNDEGNFPVLSQYIELLITDYTFLRYFWNSLCYALGITAACVLLSFPLGFLFAKVKFPRRNAVFFVYIIVMMLPFQATLLPNYIQLRDFGLLNTPLSLLLPQIFFPFAVFLFRQFIKSIPSETLDSAVLDTSSSVKVLFYVVFPQVRTAAIALSLMIFCDSWNMVEPVLIFAAKNPGIHPLSVALGDLPSSVSFSASMVYMVPVLFLFLMFKETIASSMEKFHWGK